MAGPKGARKSRQRSGIVVLVFTGLSLSGCHGASQVAVGPFTQKECVINLPDGHYGFGDCNSAAAAPGSINSTTWVPPQDWKCIKKLPNGSYGFTYEFSNDCNSATPVPVASVPPPPARTSTPLSTPAPARVPVAAPATVSRSPFAASNKTRVLLVDRGGVFVVPVRINDAIDLDFLVDSGATDVSVPVDVVLTLLRSGTLKAADFTGSKTYVLADGSKLPSATFVMKSLKIGDRTLRDVECGISPIQAELLLGQSFLRRFKSWSIDNWTHELFLE
jgi:gag-polyprotein putative aspartyl protease